VDAFEALATKRLPVPDTGSLERDLTGLIGRLVTMTVRADVDLGVLADSIHGSVMYRFLLNGSPLTPRVLERVVGQALDGSRPLP
jgi:hypothetical protein